MFAVRELGFLATRVDVAICANVMDFCVRRQPTTYRKKSVEKIGLQNQKGKV